MLDRAMHVSGIVDFIRMILQYEADRIPNFSQKSFTADPLHVKSTAAGPAASAMDIRPQLTTGLSSSIGNGIFNPISGRRYGPWPRLR